MVAEAIDGFRVERQGRGRQAATHSPQPLQRSPAMSNGEPLSAPIERTARFYDRGGRFLLRRRGGRPANIRISATSCCSVSA